MKTRLSLLIFNSISLWFLCALSVHAQKENNIWYFGYNAGLDFNSGAPVSISGGLTSSVEGTASVSNAAGNLLFYSDGISVWNANHTAMPNGTGLAGNTSSTQSALIVKAPMSSNLYYIFTTGGGLFCYSIVDMTLNGGLGDVTIKNTVLNSNSTERATAVRKSNGIDFWIIGHEISNNTFFNYSLTSAGVASSAIISATGLIHNTGGDDIGYLKASHSGNKLAVAIRYESTFELFDFDKNTGLINSPVTFPATYPYSYSVEFSPDDSKLYLGGGLFPAYIYQVDMNAGSPAAIINSAVLISNPATGGAGGALQTGPDCKIYFAKYNTSNIGVINNPDDSGSTCNYVDNQVILTSGQSQLGLPNFFETNGCFQFSFVSTCLGDTTQFSLSNTSALAGALWQFDDSASGINNSASVFNPIHVFSAAGVYNVQLVLYYLNGNTDSLNVTVIINAYPLVDLGNDTIICLGQTLTLDAGAGYTSYLWQDGSTLSGYTAGSPGTYIVTVTNGNCSSTDSILIGMAICNAPFVNFASSDTNHCEKTCMDFFDLSTNNPTSWQWYFNGGIPDTSSLQNPPSICFNSYGSFDVQLIACNANGCDSLTLFNFINIFQSPPPPVIIEINDTLFCTTAAASYQWYMDTTLIAGATQQWYVPLQGGLYYVIGTDSNLCDAASNSILITSIPLTAIPSLQLSIIPNPNNGNFQFTFHSKSQIRNLKTEIINPLGEIVYEKIFENVNGKFSHQINLSDKAKGIYILKLIGDDKIFIKKFVTN